MSTFDTDWTAVGGPRWALQTYFGEMIGYRASGAASDTVISAIVERRGKVIFDDESRREVYDELTIWVSLADVASPGVDDQVTVDGAVYKLRKVNERTAGQAELEAVLITVQVKARDGFYRNVGM